MTDNELNLEESSPSILTADNKRARLWSQLIDKNCGGDLEIQQWPDFVDISKQIGGSSCNYVMNSNDEFRLSNKVLCTHGFVACIRIQWSLRNNYTGLFRGSESGIIRLSSALKPLNNSVPWFFGDVSQSKLFPCVAIKIFRSGYAHSGNLLFGSKKTGQQNDLFFLHAVCTNLTDKVSLLLSWLMNYFRTYSTYPTQLGLSEFAKIDENGINEENPTFPWCIGLKPRENLKDIKFKDILYIPENTVLYDIYAITEPQSISLNLPPEHLGEIITTSSMIQSFDDGIFFKHQRREEDYDLRPEWLSQLTPTHNNIGSKYFDEFFGS